MLAKTVDHHEKDHGNLAGAAYAGSPARPSAVTAALILHTVCFEKNRQNKNRKQSGQFPKNAATPRSKLEVCANSAQ
jgi:hypothetical protein